MARNPWSSPSGEEVSTFTSGVSAAIAGTTRSRKRWSIGIFDFTNAFGKGRCSTGVVAWLPADVARERRDRRVDILVPAQREERHAEAGSPADRRAGIGGILRVADAHAGLDVRRAWRGGR